MTPKVLENAEASRYEIFDEDGNLMGISEYRVRNNNLSLTHTVVKPEYGGQGFAGVLTKYILDDAQTRGMGILPYCPYVRDYIAKHQEYLELVPVPRRAYFEL